MQFSAVFKSVLTFNKLVHYEDAIFKESVYPFDMWYVKSKIMCFMRCDFDILKHVKRIDFLR